MTEADARPRSDAIEKDPDILVDLMAVTTDFEGEVIVKALEAEGIPAWVFSATGRTLSAMISVTNPIRVQVRRQDLELARAALKNTREESVDLDWDEVDLGEPETPPGEPGAIDRSISRLVLLVLGMMLVLLGVLLVMSALRNTVP